METQLSNWKAMWEEQKINSQEPSEIIQKIKLIENSDRLQRYKLIGITTLLILACAFGLKELLANKYYLISFTLLLVGIIIKLLPLYNTRFDQNSGDSNFNNLQFISNLSKKMEYNVWHLLIYMLVIMGALNIALLGLTQKGTIFNFEINEGNQILFHLATVILFLVAYKTNKRILDIDRRKTQILIQEFENHQ